MFCPQCGAQIPQNANYCPACGTNAGSGGGPANAQQPVQIQITQPQAAAPQAPLHQKQKMATWKKVLLWIFGFIAVVVILALLATGDLQELADSHLAALRSGDLETAYNQTSPDFRQATPASAFKQLLEAYPVLTQHEGFSMDKRGFENNSGYVHGELTKGDKTLAKIEFQMIKIDDKWTIQGYNLKAPDK